MSTSPLIPGAEPFFIEGNDIACLIIHGLSTTPQAVHFVGDYLAREGGFTVSGPLLAGHGTSMADLLTVSPLDWIRDLVEALEQLRQRCHKIFIMGLSLGGLLTLYMAAKYPTLFAGAAPINTPLHSTTEIALLLFDLEAPEFIPNGPPDIKQPDVDEIIYEGMPLITLQQTYALLSVTRDILPRIACPTLIFQSREDHWVDPINALLILENLSTLEKKLIWLDNSYHTATLDYDKERIGAELVRFIQQQAA